MFQHSLSRDHPGRAAGPEVGHGSGGSGCFPQGCTDRTAVAEMGTFQVVPHRECLGRTLEAELGANQGVLGLSMARCPGLTSETEVCACLGVLCTGLSGREARAKVMCRLLGLRTLHPGGFLASGWC